MLIKQPVIFITKLFLISFLKKTERSYNSITLEVKRKMLFIDELVFENSRVYIDLEESIILDYEIKTDSEIQMMKDEEEKLFCVYFRKITRNNKVKSCLTEFKDYTLKNFENIQQHKLRPNFFLSHSDKEFSTELERSCGIISISWNLDLKIQNIAVKINVIEKNKDYYPEMILGSTLSQCSNAVIEDPYLLKQPYEYIKALIQFIAGSHFRLRPVQIILVTKTGEGNLLLINKLQDELSGVIELEHFQTAYIHDRNIYSNTYWITSDYGFMKRYQISATKWTSIPIGLYFNEYYGRISKSLSFLRRETKKSKNILALGFN
jgi:hypothetical protein